MEIAEMTGLDVQEARVLLEAAGGNIGLAVELHFEAGISPAAAESSDVSEEPLVTTQQRFSVLAVDAEDADDANDSDDELIFPLLAGAGDRRHGGAAAAQQQQQQQQQRHGGGRKKSRGKARGAGGSSGDAGLDIGGDYDILSLHAAADEEMASAMDEDAFPMSRRRSKGARSVPLMVPTRGGRRSGARGDDDDDDDPRPAHSPSDTASGSASGSTSHRRRAKRASQQGKASRDGGGERRSGALSASPNEGRLTPPSYAGSPSPNTPEGSYSASNLCLASVPTVRGFATPPMSSSAPNAAPPSSPPPAVDGTSGSVGASGSGGGSSGFGRNRKPASIAARAERAMSQVMWDPRFEAVRSEVVVVWLSEQLEKERKSGKEAWSQRLKHVPCETRLPQFVKAGASYLDTSPPYHLVSELRLHGKVIWAAMWLTDRVKGSGPGGGDGGPGGQQSGGGGSHGDGALTGMHSCNDAKGAYGDDAPLLAMGDTMPEELWGVILHYVCDARDLCVVAGVCTTLHRLAQEPQLWTALHRNIFGMHAGESSASADDDGEEEVGGMTRRRGDAESRRDERPTIHAGHQRSVVRSEAEMRPWRLPPAAPRPTPPAVNRGGSGGATPGTSPAIGSFGSPPLLSPSPRLVDSAGPPRTLTSLTGASSGGARWSCFTTDATGNELSRKHEEEGATVRALYFDGGGLIASADGSCVRLWSLERRKRICTLKSHQGKESLHGGSGVNCMAIDGAHLLSGGGDATLHLFDLEELSHAGALRGHAFPISAAALMPLGSHRARAISTSTDGAAKLWDAAGGLITDLLPTLGPQAPAQPLPFALVQAGGTLRSVVAGRNGRLLDVDLHAEALTASVPIPDGRIPLDVAYAARFGGERVLATCCHDVPAVQIWDARLLPDARTEASFDDLPAASRRSLVATIPLPTDAACARQLHLDGTRLLATVDYDAQASPFSRGAHSVALFDVRAAGRGQTPLLWEQDVRGDITCFQCHGERVFVGTGTGAIHLWNFSRGSHAARDLVAEDDAEWNGSEQKQKRNKFRGNLKIRGRFPKTQGFSNTRGFR